MTIRNFIFLIFILIINHSFAQEIVLSGYYNGTNLFVQNPKIGEDQYCITNIVVNGRRLNPLKQRSSFVIDLSFVEIGIPIEVRVQHHRECTPKVLNGNVIKKRIPFNFVDFQITDKKIKWSTKGERVYGKYFIRRFDKNHWTTIHALNSKNTSNLQKYEYLVSHYPGANKYQIKYLDSSGKAYVSDDIEFSSSIPSATFSLKDATKELVFSRKIQYQLMDISGRVLKQGFSDVISCKELSSGIYYLAFENQVKQFTKK